MNYLQEIFICFTKIYARNIKFHAKIIPLNIESFVKILTKNIKFNEKKFVRNTNNNYYPIISGPEYE